VSISRRIKRAKVGEWRTIKPRKDVYIHVKKVAGGRHPKWKVRHIRYVGRKKVKRIR
jgi:hypothetical protein